MSKSKTSAEDEDDPHRLPRPRRGRGRDARPKMRDGMVTDDEADDLRAAALLRGRSCAAATSREAPDITARICGICPVAYQMSRCRAMEQLAGVEVDGQLRALRRLLYCGEWIESHTLHVFMLHAPDFLGVASAVELAKINPALVETALRLKKIGNEVMRVVGGREVHPINVRVGGWYKAPTRAQLDALVPDLEWAHEASLEDGARSSPGSTSPSSSRTTSSSRSTQTASTRSTAAAGSSPIAGSTSRSPTFLEHVVEEHVEHSNALHARLRERGSYLVGPLARYALHRDQLSPQARRGARPRPGSSRSCATRSARSSSARSSSCTPARRRCA